MALGYSGNRLISFTRQYLAVAGHSFSRMFEKDGPLISFGRTN